MSLIELENTFKEIDVLTEKARKMSRELMGGISFQKEFGIYTMNIPNNEAFFNYLERHFVEAQKLLQCFQETLKKQEDA